MSPNYCSYMELILEKPFSTHSFHILHCIPVINICHNVVPLRKSTYSLVSLQNQLWSITWTERVLWVSIAWASIIYITWTPTVQQVYRTGQCTNVAIDYSNAQLFVTLLFSSFDKVSTNFVANAVTFVSRIVCQNQRPLLSVRRNELCPFVL